MCDLFNGVKDTGANRQQALGTKHYTLEEYNKQYLVDYYR